MPFHVGTSGWQYRDWRGRFSPAAMPQRQWLEHHAAAFATVEVNNSFDNDPGGAALRDAVTLAGLLREVGRTPTRVPEMDAASGDLAEPRRR